MIIFQHPEFPSQQLVFFTTPQGLFSRSGNKGQYSHHTDCDILLTKTKVKNTAKDILAFLQSHKVSLSSPSIFEDLGFKELKRIKNKQMTDSWLPTIKESIHRLIHEDGYYTQPFSAYFDEYRTTFLSV